MDKESWLKELTHFIVEANQNTWAANTGKVAPFLPNHKTHRYERAPWEQVDDYSGYFRAPGLTVVSYNNMPAWHLYYGGIGMAENQSDQVKEAFQFLRAALMQVTPDMPIRGPSEYQVEDWLYTFNMKGDILDCRWTEKVLQKQGLRNPKLIFRQDGRAGIYIHRTYGRKPLYPWNL